MSTAIQVLGICDSPRKAFFTSTVLHPWQEICDANSHMEHGAAETYDKLAEYLTSIA